MQIEYTAVVKKEGDWWIGYYLECLQKAKTKCCCRLYSYVLMTNHVHLLMEPCDPGDLGRFMQSVGRRYVRYINETYHRLVGGAL